MLLFTQMNYAPGILALLSQAEDLAEVLLVPGALPVQRTILGVQAIGDHSLSALDVRDTLTTLLSHAPGGGSNLGRQGVVSFGMPDRGRFRVSYFMQRGSLAASVLHVPLKIPRTAALLNDPATVAAAEKAFRSFRSGLLVVIGSQPALTNAFVYALLNHVNENDARIVFILESYTSFLLRHNQSVVVQCEIGSDVDNLEQGMRTAFSLTPNILYVRDIIGPVDLHTVLKAAEARVFVVVTVSSLDVDTLFPGGRVPLDPALVRGLWRLDRMEDGHLHLDMSAPVQPPQP